MTVYFKMIHLDHWARTYLDLKVDKPPNCKNLPQAQKCISPQSSFWICLLRNKWYILLPSHWAIMKAILCSTEGQTETSYTPSGHEINSLLLIKGQNETSYTPMVMMFSAFDQRTEFQTSAITAVSETGRQTHLHGDFLVWIATHTILETKVGTAKCRLP